MTPEADPPAPLAPRPPSCPEHRPQPPGPTTRTLPNVPPAGLGPRGEREPEDPRSGPTRPLAVGGFASMDRSGSGSNAAEFFVPRPWFVPMGFENLAFSEAEKGERRTIPIASKRAEARSTQPSPRAFRPHPTGADEMLRFAETAGPAPIRSVGIKSAGHTAPWTQPAAAGLDLGPGGSPVPKNHESTPGRAGRIILREWKTRFYDEI